MSATQALIGTANKVIAGGEEAATLMLDGKGMILDCNRSGEALFKYRRSEMVWRHVSMLFPQLSELELIQNCQPNPHLRFLCRIGRQFQGLTQEGGCFACDLFLNALDNTGRGLLSLIARP